MSFATHWRFLRKRKNKLLYAVTHNTAAEIASSRADSSKPNLGLTSWKGTKVLSFQSSSVLSIFLLIYFILMPYFTDYQLQRYKKCRNPTNNSLNNVEIRQIILGSQGQVPWFTIIKPFISSQIFPFDSKNRRIIWRKKIKSLFLQYHCF